MKKELFKPVAGTIVRQPLALAVTNVAVHEARADGSFEAAAEDSLLAQSGFKPDRWKAYMEFDICHALPVVAGPVAQGFYVGYTPVGLEGSHASLFHQQVNLGHILKAYELEDGVKNPKDDRIVGCTVATRFPKAPPGGWKIGDDPATAPCIRACAVIFKLANGVNRLMGDHQTSRQKQSVSIEAITSYDNLGIYFPSRGPDQIIPLMELEEEAIIEALTLNPLSLAPVNGEQGVFVYGINRPFDLRGVGITPRPAEAEAKIISFAAETKEVNGGTLVAMAASQVDQNLMGARIKFATGRTGEVKKVTTEGKARLTGCKWGIEASEADPMLEIILPDKRKVLRTLSSLAGRMKKSDE